MKRTLLLLLLSVSTLWGQFLPDIPDRLSYAAQLNGTSQYFSKATPPKMDLNGSEVLTVTTTFDANTTGWIGLIASSAVSVNTTSLDRIRSGSGSMRVVMASPPSASSGVRVQTAISNSLTSGTTNKFTWEGWFYVPSTDSSKTIIIGATDQAGATFAENSPTVLVSNTWTKLVVNFQCPGTQSGIMVKARLAFAGLNDTLYVDDVSLTQAYDGAVSVEAKTTSGSTQTLAGTSKSNASRLRIWQNTATASVTLTDGTTSVTATNSATVNDGRFHKWGVTWSKTGNLTLYIDGVAGTGQSITGVGAITVDTLWIGRDQAGNYFNGQLGEKIRVRYSSLPSDIAQWIYRATYERFIPEPPGGGTTVLRLFGRYNDTYDYSGNQGVLTNTGSTPIIQKQ